jgi:phosphotransacetylase
MAQVRAVLSTTTVSQGCCNGAVCGRFKSSQEAKKTVFQVLGDRAMADLH